MKKPKDDSYLKVYKVQEIELSDSKNALSEAKPNLEDSIKSSEELLGSLGYKTDSLIVKTTDVIHTKKPIKLRSWNEIKEDAESKIDYPVTFFDLLSEDEITEALNKVSFLREEFDSIHRLDAMDWTICGIAGILASLVDIFLIQIPKHPGFLGGKESPGGSLSNFIKDKINTTLSPEEVRTLEKDNWVPYDPVSSIDLTQQVDGLSPSMHRLQSLGHDPVLGFIFGVKDILCGTFTAIDKNGCLITQAVDMTGKDTLGMNLFEAIARVFGHMKSDITTPRGLPVPFMALFQKLDFGNIGGYKISEITRIMYRSGYDFRHFLSMSISPLIIEVIVRLSYLIKRLIEGHKIKDSIPFNILGNKKPKLLTMLFTAHAIATAANAGKVAISQNPLSINYAQWMAFIRYLIPQINWVLFEKEMERHDYVMDKLDIEWASIDTNLNKTWALFSNDYFVIS